MIMMTDRGIWALQGICAKAIYIDKENVLKAMIKGAGPGGQNSGFLVILVLLHKL
jgi:hypothetical protein